MEKISVIVPLYNTERYIEEAIISLLNQTIKIDQILDWIRKAGGMVDDGRVMGNLNLSRSIGDLEYKKNNSIPQKDQMITSMLWGILK